MFTDEQGFQNSFSYSSGASLATELCLLVIPVLQYHVLSEDYADLQAKDLPYSSVKLQLCFLGLNFQSKNNCTKMSPLAIPIVCLGYCHFLTLSPAVNTLGIHVNTYLPCKLTIRLIEKQLPLGRLSKKSSIRLQNNHKTNPTFLIFVSI